MKNISNNDFQQCLKLVGANLRKTRIDLGFTQEKLAEMIGTDYKYYQRIESGTANITMKTLYKLCESLKIDPMRLFDKE